jgi:WD40 repeat protein
VLVTTLEGHSKGVISFSWTSCGQLLSGGWDGLAILWNLASNTVLRRFGPHENGVNVLGLPNGLVATTSTGESVESKPANFKLRLWNPTTGLQVGPTIEDHGGPIRSIAFLPGVEGMITTSNDGSVVLRSGDGQAIEALMHPLQEDGSPPMVLNW